MVGDDSGKLPALLAELIQLLLVRRFLFRQIADEGFVLPHSLVFHIDHRRDRRGGRIGKIESAAHVAPPNTNHHPVQPRLHCQQAAVAWVLAARISMRTDREETVADCGATIGVDARANF